MYVFHRLTLSSIKTENFTETKGIHMLLGNDLNVLIQKIYWRVEEGVIQFQRKNRVQTRKKWGGGGNCYE